ncbi:MAG: hypothetical protein GEV08_14910 [Acidimicrobiia bacterium]|nr:hypothetical protein [Acidimicrobiia bacterium]
MADAPRPSGSHDAVASEAGTPLWVKAFVVVGAVVVVLVVVLLLAGGHGPGRHGGDGGDAPPAEGVEHTGEGGHGT